ncbi:hypothetical protein AB7C87_11335 [Natrarchaeobius sp. A-rgal3]|uniref:hypothetical protein n=1 Tax=Natrarchaeobius versutus TaxID=1679078 RepID=UPI0035103E98
MSLLRLVEGATIPWVSIAGVGVVTAVLVGPVVWFVRDRFSERRRERLTLVSFGLAMILVPIALGLSLAFGVPRFVPSFDSLILGSYLGCVIVLLGEQTLVPKRLRAAD